MRPRRSLASLSLLALGPLLASGCGPDPEPLDCSGQRIPTFVVVVVAPDGPLPPDTSIRVLYGGSSTEEYHADRTDKHEVVFCRPSAADGGALLSPRDAGTDADASGTGGAAGESALALEAGAAGQASGEGGSGGGSDQPDASVPSDAGTEDPGLTGLRCDLYTDGPATLEIEATEYAPLEVKLRLSPKLCTVVETIELSRLDGGV